MSGYASIAVDVDQLYLTANYNCLAGLDDYAYVMVRTFTGDGVVDPFAPLNIQNAENADLLVGCYHVPCSGMSAETQIDLNFAALHAASVASDCGNLFIKVFDNPSPHCAWNKSTPEANCNFIKELLNATYNNPHFSDTGNLGVFSSQEAWNSIVGPECFGFQSQYSVWYRHLNDNSTCADWPSQQFSDFQSDSVLFKQYASSYDKCGFNASHADSYIQGCGF